MTTPKSFHDATTPTEDFNNLLKIAEYFFTLVIQLLKYTQYNVNVMMMLPHFFCQLTSHEFIPSGLHSEMVLISLAFLQNNLSSLIA